MRKNNNISRKREKVRQGRKKKPICPGKTKKRCKDNCRVAINRRLGCISITLPVMECVSQILNSDLPQETVP